MSGSSDDAVLPLPADAGRSGILLPAFAALLLVVAVLLYVGPVQHLPQPATSFRLPWPLLTAAFLVAEIAVVHYDFRSESHSFSLSELALIFGLFFAGPAQLVSAQVVGAGVALVAHRRQTGLKLVFNLAHFGLGACLAVLVFSALRNSSEVLGAQSWPAALLAAVVSSAMSTMAIFAAISLSEGRADVRKLPEQLALALLATVGGSSLALLAADATARHPSAIVLLAVPVGTFVLAYRAYVTQRQEHDGLEFLYESARILDAAPDLPSALNSMLRRACLTFRVEVAQFALSDGDRPALLVTTTADEVRGSGYVERDELGPLLELAIRSQTPHRLEPKPPAPGPEGLLLHEVLLGPVGGNTKSKGALLLGNRLGTSSFSAAQVRLFRTLIAQIDVSLENGRLAQMLGEATRYAERERRNSLELQRGLLPARLPERDDVSIAVRYQPSGLGAEVGGDWYDVVVLPSGGLGVVIGDVIGHDLRSAARMAQARSALRAYATEGHGPVAVMERLNALLAQTDPDFMGTCCYAEIEPSQTEPGARTVSFVLSGHPPPLFVPRHGPTSLVDADPGIPLGVDDAATYVATVVEVRPGAALVLYTDGLVESKATPLIAGLERLVAVPGVSGAASVEDIADRLLDSIPPGEASDDVALVVVRCDGSPARVPMPREAPTVFRPR